MEALRAVLATSARESALSELSWTEAGLQPADSAKPQALIGQCSFFVQEFLNRQVRLDR